VTTIVGTPEGIYADGETGVVLQHLTVRGEAGPEPGASAYRIRLVNGASVKLQRVVAHAYAERWVGTVRTECLDRLLIVGRSQLERVLRIYIQHYGCKSSRWTGGCSFCESWGWARVTAS
jgi:hypothetical protein